MAKTILNTKILHSCAVILLYLCIICHSVYFNWFFVLIDRGNEQKMVFWYCDGLLIADFNHFY